MTLDEIRVKFELLVDDSTELSIPEETDLANDVYQDVCSDRDWEFLKDEFTFTTDGTASIALPDDFSHLIADYNYTENNMNNDMNTAGKVVLINNSPYTVVNYSDRRRYSGAYCYVDIANSTLNFVTAPASGLSGSTDYIVVPEDMELTDTPVFPARFHKMIAYGMASSDYIIQQTQKTDSYSPEYQTMYDKKMKDMALWNAGLQNN